MSIASTRKVSGSPSPSKRTERSYAIGARGESFVENIDTTNNVSINDDSSNRHNDSGNSFNSKEEEKEEKANISTTPTYVVSAIEALEASGVYDNSETAPEKNASRKISVYDNNLSIIKEKNNERSGHPYLKHFYERNEIVEEIDELV